MQVNDAALEYKRRVEDAYKSIFGMLKLDCGLSNLFVRQPDQRSHEVDKQRAPVRRFVSDDGCVWRMVARLRNIECAMQFCCKDTGVMLCSQDVSVLRKIRCVTFWYWDFKKIDPECQRLSTNQDGWLSCFQERVKEFWKVARLEPIVTSDHGLTRHANDAEFVRINLWNELGPRYRFYN